MLKGYRASMSGAEENTGHDGALSKHPVVTGPIETNLIMTHESERLKPGEKTPHSGLYEMVGPRGGHTGETIVSEKGKPLPSTDAGRS